MSINRDEALRAQDLAEGLMKKNDFTAARKLAMKAQKMDATLENISRMIMVCDVHCASIEKSFGNEMDWYGILQVEPKDDDVIIKKQYKRLALLLHPDKNKLPGAEAAFKLIGEAQRILLDNEKRTLHDIKRKSCKKPAPASKAQQVPRYPSKPVYQASVNMRNIFNGFKPENRYPQQKSQAQPAGFSHLPTFWTSCPFCKAKYEYRREYIKLDVTCQICKKQFTAFETAFQSVPVAKSSCQTTYSFPQQNTFPGQKACNEPQKHPDKPATVPSRKTSVSKPGSTAENNNGKRKRKNMDEFIESDSDSSSGESEDVLNDDTMAARDLGSKGGQQPARRSDRSKRQVSYNESLSDDDVDLSNKNGEGSKKTIDTEMEEEPEDEKQTHKDHHSTESLPNGVNPKEKMKEDQVESSAGVNDLKEDLSAAKPNLINYDDPDFNDFDTFRDKSLVQACQIWALYDDGEGMPRFYALIKKVTTTPKFSIKYVWLEAEEENETQNLPASVGTFELGDEQKADECSPFSHLVHNKTRSRARRFKIFPKKGEMWALYKNWNKDLSSDSDSSREYEFVEIVSDHAEGATVLVGFLSKVEGFSCVFCPLPKDESDTLEIPPDEFCRFSHRIPHFRLTGTEGRGVKEGWYELDPAALPAHDSQDQDHQSPPSGSAS